MDEGKFVKKIPCDECGSSRTPANSVYQHENDKGEIYYDAYCFACGKYTKPSELLDFNPEDVDTTMSTDDFSDIYELPCRGWRARNIGKEVSEFYSVRTEWQGDNKNGDAAKRYYPVTKGGSVCGFKIRDCESKEFYTRGTVKNHCEFFGQSLFSGGSKFLIITGGEEDALSMQQAMKQANPNYTTAVVSPIGGEGSLAKQIKANYEWVTSFEQVVIMMDNDEAGKKAAEEGAKLLKPGQARIANLTLKDPNDYVRINRSKELVDAFWKAERYSPIDILTLGQMWSEFEEGAQQSIIPFPEQFGQLNEMLGGGVAAGEVTVVGALTSVGKTAVINNLVYSFFQNTDLKIGLVYLESTPREIVSSLLSIHMEENLNLYDPRTLDMGRLKKKFQDMVQEDNRIISVDHQGAFTSTDELFNKIQWMCRAMGTKIVVIDPLQAAIPSNDNSDIDSFMDGVLKLAKQTDSAIFVVSHMKKPEGKDPHEVNEYDMKGSTSINQISFNTILLSRDKTNEDDNIRNSTRLQVVKCRRTGFTGEAGWLRYDPTRAKMYACDNPYIESEPKEDVPAFDSSDSGEQILSEKAEKF